MKPRVEFSANRASHDRLATYCKKCAVENERTRGMNPVVAAYKREWQRQWRAENRDKAREYARKWSGTEKGRYKLLLSMARQRDLVVEISLEDYRQIVRDAVCCYCGGGLPPRGHGIDRKDSRLGYTKDNTVPCCALCNRLKAHLLSYGEMMMLAEGLRLIRVSRESANAKGT